MQTQSATNNGIRSVVESSPVAFEKMYKNDIQKEGTLTAQIRQTIIKSTFYPSKRVDSNMQENLFSTEEFGFGEQQFDGKEERVAWILVPENITEAAIMAKLAAANSNGACIYKVLSNEPILDDNQKYAISQQLRTLNHYANAQAVRYPENHDTTPNKLILDKEGNVQYRRTYFWLTPKEDQDIRSTAKVYVSPEIAAELNGASVLQGQTIE